MAPTHRIPQQGRPRRKLGAALTQVTRTVARALRGRLAALGSAPEHGAIMFITAAGMTVVVAMGSLAIDTANWYQKHHATQLAADAAALAAANCLADAGSYGNTCTSTTDTVAAAQVAATIAGQNGLPIQPSAVDINLATKQVTIKGSEKSPGILSNIAGISQVTASASSGADYNQQYCPTAGSSCYAIFAYNSGCNSAHAFNAVGSPGVTNDGNSSVITGGVHSNGNIYNVGNLKDGVFPPPEIVSWGGSCMSSDNSYPGTQATAGSSMLPYPIDFSGLSPTADNNDVAPPTCTYTAGLTSGVLLGVAYNPLDGSLSVGSGAPSGVYCDPGGQINITGSGASGGYNQPGGDTFIAKSFGGLYNNNVSLSAYNNGSANPYHLLLYQVSSNWNGSTCSSQDPTNLVLGGNTKQVVNGVVFAPCATIAQYANNSGDNMFLEGYNVNLMGNATFDGIGPSPALGIYTGTDQLNQ